MPTLEKIQAKMIKLQAQAESLIAKRAQSVIGDIRKLMEKHGLTPADIAAHFGARKRPGRAAGAASKSATKRATVVKSANDRGERKNAGKVYKSKDWRCTFGSSASAAVSQVLALSPYLPSIARTFTAPRLSAWFPFSISAVRPTRAIRGSHPGPFLSPRKPRLERPSVHALFFGTCV